MLGSYFFSRNFFKAGQSGFYVDFLYKCIAEVIVRNVFIYTAQFFAEKYMIEVFSKKIFESSIFFFKRFAGITTLSSEYFFFTIVFMFLCLYVFSIMLFLCLFI